MRDVSLCGPAGHIVDIVHVHRVCIARKLLRNVSRKFLRKVSDRLPPHMPLSLLLLIVFVDTDRRTPCTLVPLPLFASDRLFRKIDIAYQPVSVALRQMDPIPLERSIVDRPVPEGEVDVVVYEQDVMVDSR